MYDDGARLHAGTEIPRPHHLGFSPFRSFVNPALAGGTAHHVGAAPVITTSRVRECSFAVCVDDAAYWFSQLAE